MSLLTTVGLSLALASSQPALLGERPVTCEGKPVGTLYAYDTDGDPANGAERIVIKGSSGAEVVVIFAPGTEPVVTSVSLQLPGKAPVPTSLESLDCTLLDADPGPRA